MKHELANHGACEFQTHAGKSGGHGNVNVFFGRGRRPGRGRDIHRIEKWRSIARVPASYVTEMHLVYVKVMHFQRIVLKEPVFRHAFFPPEMDHDIGRLNVWVERYKRNRLSLAVRRVQSSSDSSQ